MSDNFGELTFLRGLLETWEEVMLEEGSEWGDWMRALTDTIGFASSSGNYDKANQMAWWAIEDLEAFYNEGMFYDDSERYVPMVKAAQADWGRLVDEAKRETYYKITDEFLARVPEFMKVVGTPADEDTFEREVQSLQERIGQLALERQVAELQLTRMLEERMNSD